jgi:hypothetical protein
MTLTVKDVTGWSVRSSRPAAADILREAGRDIFEHSSILFWHRWRGSDGLVTVEERFPRKGASAQHSRFGAAKDRE